MSTPFDRMQQEFQDKEYRHEYADGFLNSKIATQLKVLREQREWTQQQLAQATGMQQARISVMEDVDYSSWSISTLRRYARAFDVRLDVEFKEFGTLWPDLQKLNRDSLQKRSFNDDQAFQQPASELEPRTARQTISEEIPVNLIKKAVGADRYPSQPPFESSYEILQPIEYTNVIRFPIERTRKTQHEEPPYAALSSLAR